MYKHWMVHHQGARTRFKVKVVGFFSSALERQVAESVRIDKCGATQILNSKRVFSRCKIPVDTEKADNLGDRELTMGELDDEVFEMEKKDQQVILTGDNLRKSEEKKKRRERVVDNLNWGL